ncbi:hypothetical protein PspLS_07994 [Pyricularia sp. CBS 133598]|nr:hypothetical protein PspLS_07994 [Pyricularia sp. CBS 133598]
MSKLLTLNRERQPTMSSWITRIRITKSRPASPSRWVFFTAEEHSCVVATYMVC